MQTRLKKLEGFTLVELLTVLVIIAILAAVAAPIYTANTQRAKASEAVATMSSIREAERDFVAGGGSYFDIAKDNIQTPLPSTVSGGVPNPSPSGVGFNTGTVQYFSSNAYTVAVSTLSANGVSGQFKNPNATDFTILVQGNNSVTCGTSGSVTDCAIKVSDVDGKTTANTTYCLEMDDTGRTFVSYNNVAGCTGAAPTTTWSSY